MTTLRFLRRLLRGSDTRRAARDEAEVMTAEEGRALEPVRRRRAAYGAAAGDVVLGTATEGGWPVGLSLRRLMGHAAIFGPTGAGKSYLLALIVQGLLRSGVKRFLILDPKSETVAIVKRVIAAQAGTLPSAEREDLLGRTLCLDLFSSERLPRLQVLAGAPGEDPELAAFEIANLITTELDQGIGVRQEPLLHRTIECLIRSGLAITALPAALRPEVLEALAETAPDGDLFRAVAQRLRMEPRDRVLGLTARVERLVRIKATRLALGGSATCIDLAAMLDDRITLVDLAPPMGSADIGRFLAGLFWISIAHAIRRRPPGSPPCFVMVDEWPTFLAGGGSRLADSFEDLVRLARSRNVFLTVLAQDMASVEKISRSLRPVLIANTHLIATFRSTDPAAWDFILPVTGRRPKPRPAPWEEARPGFLDRGAELALLRDELSHLPDRECFLVDRRTGLPAVGMRTADLMADPSPGDMGALEAAAARQPEVATVAELEAGLAATQRRIDALTQGRPDPARTPAGAAQLRRKGGGTGIG